MKQPAKHAADGLTGPVQELASVATATAGISVAAMDPHIFEAALKRRMRATATPNASAYLALHGESTEEREAYLEEVLIGETSFFRDAAVFDEMKRWAVAWKASNARSMRILSAPCSTGEEPYSIATALLDAGFEGQDFTIDALDISAMAIEHARSAVYQGFALRNVADPATAAYLEPHGKAWKVRDGVRDRVQFRRANLLDDDALAGCTYDLIFARNLLIYQTPQARQRLASLLARALACEGRLVVGSADWGPDLEELFVLELPVQSFALRLRSVAAAEPVHSPERVFGGDVKIAESTVLQATHPSTQPITTENESVRAAAALAETAVAASDRGDPGTAEWICRQALYLDPANLRALELLERLERPRASRRMHLALHARLHRLRSATAEGKTS